MAYPGGIVKYDIKYQSILANLSNKVLSKEKIDSEKEKAVEKNFPFTREQKYFI